MRILLLNFEYPPLGGGGGIETRDLAEELAKQHEVHVLTTWYKGLSSTEQRDGVHIHRVRVLGRRELPVASLLSLVTFAPAAFFHGIRLVLRFRPDIVNAHFVVPSGVPAALLSLLFRLPFALTIIGGDIYDPSKGVSPHRHVLLRLVVRWVLGRAHALTSISSDIQKRTVELYGVVKPIDVIPLGLVPLTPVVRTKKQLHWKTDVIHFITVGRLVPRKGYADLLRAFVTLPNNTLLHIIGDGPLLRDMEELMETLQCANRVILHGRVSDEEKYTLLHAADVYVSASHHEGFGIVFLEAMRMGLPIVATNIGGQTDILREGKNALLVPPHDIEHLAEAMKTLMNNTELRLRMTHDNTRDVETFSIYATAKRYEDLYRHALPAHRI